MARFAFSDLHGNYKLWEMIKAATQPDDILYCLGDNIDRGPDGFKICAEQAEMKNIFVLQGNHEAMAAAAIPDLYNDRQTREARLWFQNGGDRTWDSIKLLPPHIIEHFANWCGSLDTTMGILNDRDQVIYLDHAGFTLGQENLADPLWDRSHFWDSWPEDEVYESHTDWDKASNTYLVHGHSPVQYLVKQLAKVDPNWTHEINKTWEIKNNIIKPKIIEYCNGHKFDIDLGTTQSNRTALFNLDTFEVKYFDSD